LITMLPMPDMMAVSPSLSVCSFFWIEELLTTSEELFEEELPKVCRLGMGVMRRPYSVWKASWEFVLQTLSEEVTPLLGEEEETSEEELEGRARHWTW
jgi:hypothetical protein